MLTVFNHNILIFALVSIYYLKIFAEICTSMGLLLFTPSKNVYICGLLHMGHMKHMKYFEKASKLGNRLLVGIHDDNEVSKYKEIPTLTMEERSITASMCKGVSKVISSAPLVLTEDFIKEHNIHVVACSSEYDNSEDSYYVVPRKMGILKIIPRIDGISTTELMERVKKNDKKHLKLKEEVEEEEVELISKEAEIMWQEVKKEVKQKEWQEKIVIVAGRKRATKDRE